MSVHIVSGPARVVDSGQVTAFGGNPIRLDLELENKPITVVFEFSSDASAQGLDVRTRYIENGLAFELVNFDGADGRGSSVPVLVAELTSSLVFLHFRVFRFGRTEDRTLHYTLYQADKQAVGWAPVDQGTGRG